MNGIRLGATAGAFLWLLIGLGLAALVGCGSEGEFCNAKASGENSQATATCINERHEAEGDGNRIGSPSDDDETDDDSTSSSEGEE